MNTLLKPLTRERNVSERMPERDIATGREPAHRIEYDDGEPATIVPIPRTPHPARARRDGARPCDQTMDDADMRSPLATIAREAIVEYDDGNPGTVVC